MIAKIREAADRRRAGEEGFTLIELLVVVVVLVALAAIAIPVLLNQREKAVNASAQTLTSNLANAVSTGIGTGGLWTDADRDTALASDGSAAITGQLFTDAGVQAIPTDADVYINTTTGAFCVSAEGAGNTAFWKYTSAAPEVASDVAACTAPAG